MSKNADKSSMIAAQKFENLWFEGGRYYLTLGFIYYQFEYWSNAACCFESALQSFENKQDLHATGQSLILLGNAQAYLSQYQRAGRCYQRAVYTFSQLDALHETVYALRKLGLTRYWSGSLKSSVKLLEQAALYCEQGVCPYEEAFTLVGLGHLYCEQKKYAFALSCYESAADIFNKFPKTGQMVRYQAEIKEAVGQVCELTNHLELSLKYYIEALILYKELELVEAMRQVCYRLARIYKGLGHSMTALHCQKQANALILA